MRAITCLLYNVIIISHFQCNNEPLMNSAGLWSWSRRLGLKTYQCLVWSCLHKNCRHLGLGHLHLMCKTNFWPNCEGHVKINYHRDDDRRWSLSRSWSFKVTNFDTKGKPICYFKVNNTKVHPISYRFSVIAQYLSNYCLWQRDASR